ncbi:long-chain fatty acid--CoA ligase [Tuberibacillus sp. Marseille-P3662]|uniref:long-chain fatty acid--CoA ligase n=1 Tax=Tuberibacillus sp. Marseille-P3662 TaxID=1965358 RepID=UPI000A1CC5AE|nr:long-chain fatty acid--CoA ligase [Tuberibacillus sp. Marseille-P3662]
MQNAHFKHWPKRVPKTHTVPETTLFDNLEVTARRYPNKTAIHYYGNDMTYKQVYDETLSLAGFLQHQLGVTKGDRVLLYMQNSPQFVISYYAILRADAVVVPINPMNVANELSFYIDDTQAKVAVIGQELLKQIEPSLKTTSLTHLVVAAYSDYAGDIFSNLPDVVKEPAKGFEGTSITTWLKALSYCDQPDRHTAASDDIAVLPYTSGTTGKPKGCIHTHKTVQANAVGTCDFQQVTSDAVVLTSLPLFHVTGMEHSMNAPIFSGSAMVMMTRWNRDMAGELIQRYGCSHWTNIATMVIDFLANPNLPNFDLSSLSSIGGGGAPLPKAVGEKLYEVTGVQYAEGYGLSETISQTHFNPPDRPKLQCMGIPSFDVDARIVDPESLQELGPHQEGEVVVNGPQVFKGYWQRPEDTNRSFMTIAGQSFFRTGDIATYDDEGYYFMVDRVKRMINASGFKVWPAEVESALYKHPAVEQACVIGVPDERRGETVKACIVLNEKERGRTSAEAIIAWSKQQMAAYKYPRIVEFLEELPVSGSGKILWRKLQERERAISH